MDGPDEALLGVAAAIARSAVDPSAWDEVVGRLGRLLPGATPHLLGRDAALGQALPQVTHGFDPDWVGRYVAHYHALNPYPDRWQRLPPGVVAALREVLPEDELLATPYYHEWLRPQEDLRAGALVVLAREPGRILMFGAHLPHRHREAGEPAVLRTLAALAPLMRQALDINRTLLAERLGTQALRAGVEPAGAGLLLLSAGGLILHADSRADAMLAAGAPLRADPAGRLRLPDAGAERGLARALSPEPRWPGAPRAGSRLAWGEGPHRATADLLPVPPDLLERLGASVLRAGRACALLLVVRPGDPPAREGARLARALGLSPAEAEVALLLAEGLSAAEAAERRGVSVETVRSQVKAALAKLGERRASGLVARVERARRRG